MATGTAFLDEMLTVVGLQDKWVPKIYFLYIATLNASGGLVQQTVQIVARFAHTI